ncbi:SDR family NAD(P)-dependent oxidoreductase [Niabella aurantiaca]|uniref:SDR family NAD(P)-dependent oxidoreductase n=1 Tax=Niabella aurantiaca TaxID=379900 RepID=UPI0003674CEF|nr:SDR family oxidoreductase [Niabella aurantiaca]
MNLNEKNILVTGGGGFGVGEGVCKALLSCGARLIVNEKDPEKTARVSEKFPGVLTIAADIAKTSEVASMFERIEKEVGVLHGLVNNAGIGLSKPAHEITEQEFDQLYQIDIRSVWLISKFFIQQLLKNDITGNIVNISSVHAHSTIPGHAIYASAKSAVEGLTRGMAVDLGQYNIRVNAVAPGYVHAEQNYDLLRSVTDNPEQWVENIILKEQVIHTEIQPEDCGYTVGFLLSDLSRAITGQTLYVDNGSTIQLFAS